MDRIVVPVTSAAAATAIAALTARGDMEVIAVAVDVGGGPTLDALRLAALHAGAVRCHVDDRRAWLAAEVLWPALRVGALAVAGEPVVTALSMTAVAQAVAAVAEQEEAASVAVFAEDPRERQRLRALLRGLAPTLGVVATTCADPALVEQNVWARVDVLAGDTAAPTAPVPNESAAVELTIGFAAGRPVALDGVPLSPVDLIARLEAIVRAHGVRPFVVRGDSGDDRRWRVQAPVAMALHRAWEGLTARTLDDRTAAFAETVAYEYATLIRDGLWFTALRDGLDAFVGRVLAPATGTMGVRLAHGEIEVQE